MTLTYDDLDVDLSPSAVRTRLQEALEDALVQSGLVAEDAAALAADHASSENRRQALTEGDTTSVERHTVSKISAGLAQTVSDIQAALARVEAGTYGQCTRCSKAIPAPRLEARPAAAECVLCASRR